MKRLPFVFCSFATALGCALQSNPCSAAGQGSGVLKFTWDAPAECPSTQQVQMEISRLLHGDVKVREGGDLDVRITVHNGETWSADITTFHAGQPGRRLIEAPTCPSVADTAALIVALMIDPDTVGNVSQEPKEVPPSAAHRAEHESIEFLAGPHVQSR